MTTPTMSTHTKPTGTRPGRARIIGTPGGSVLADYRHATAAYRRLPIKWVALAVVLTLAVIGAAAYSLGHNPWAVIAVVAAGFVVVDFTSRFPSPAATIAVIALGSVLSTPFAVMYAAAAAGSNADQYGAVTTVVAILILTGLLAHRTSRGRPWVTTLLVAVGIMFVGPFLLLFNRWLGFAWAWLIMAVVLALRGGSIAWIRDQAHDLAEALGRRRTKALDELPAPLRDLAAKHDAQQRTGTLLSDLPDGYVVFHDRKLPNGVTLDHLVVGPTGVHLIESEKFKGRVTEDPQHGLTHPDVNVADLLNDTDTLAALTRRRLRLRNVYVASIVVLHEAVLPTSRARVALSAGDDTLGTVTITTPAALTEAITDAPTVFNTRRVRRVTARIDRAIPPATRNTVPAKGIAAVPATVTVLDDDGHPPTPTTPTPLFDSSNNNVTLTTGQPVTLLTNQGVFSGYRVSGDPFPNEDTGVIYLPVTNNETHATTSFPLDSIEPAS